MGYQSHPPLTRLSASAAITRPGDTTAYASGDLVANDTTAANVLATIFRCYTVANFPSVIGRPRSVIVRRAGLAKSTTGITNPSFRLHLFNATLPAGAVVTNGDNGAFAPLPVSHDDWKGAFDISCHIQKAAGFGWGGPAIQSGTVSALDGIEVPLVNDGTYLIIHALLEARAAYAPGNAETITPWIDFHVGQV